MFNIKSIIIKYMKISKVKTDNKLPDLIKNKLWLQIVICMFLGIAIGIVISPEGFAMISEKSANLIIGWLVLPGHIFLALIKMIMIPLIFSSIILGIAGTENLSKLKSLGLKIAPYFVLTTTISVIFGAIIANSIKPGKYIDQAFVNNLQADEIAVNANMENAATQNITSIHDRIISLIPTNPFDAAINESMLQLVVFAIFIGIALTVIKASHAKPLIGLAKSFQELSMVIVSWAMFIAPIAVLGLLAQITMKIGIKAMIGMSIYVVSVLLGLLVLLIFYVIIACIFGKMKPVDFLSAIKEVQLLAFSTSSSAAVMPISIKTAQEKLKVKPATANFVIPLGATINMDGTAIYQVIAAIFLTQVFGVDLTLGELILLITTTIGASIGTPSTPGVGIVVLATILTNFGVPISGIALIIGVDRILDMSRTAINVSGDLTACVVMNRWLKDK